MTAPDSASRVALLAASVAGLNDLNENPIFRNAANDLVRLRQLVNHGGGLLGTVHALGAQKPRNCRQILAVFQEAAETASEALALIRTIPREVNQLRDAIPESTTRADQLVKQAAEVAGELLGQSPADEAYAQLSSLATAKLLFELQLSSARRAVTEIPSQLAKVAPNVRFVLAAQQRPAQLCGDP